MELVIKQLQILKPINTTPVQEIIGNFRSHTHCYTKLLKSLWNQIYYGYAAKLVFEDKTYYFHSNTVYDESFNVIGFIGSINATIPNILNINHYIQSNEWYLRNDINPKLIKFFQKQSCYHSVNILSKNSFENMSQSHISMTEGPTGEIAKRYLLNKFENLSSLEVIDGVLVVNANEAIVPQDIPEEIETLEITEVLEEPAIDNMVNIIGDNITFDPQLDELGF